jgi:cytochrome c oxidase assembly protein subunit 15
LQQPVASMTTAQTAFRVVTLLALVAAVAQVTLGGIVRVTGSGDACPDWPLCHGQFIPPFDYHTILEYSHRLSATVVGFLVLGALFIAWRYYRSSRPAIISTSAGMLLVIAAAILGGLTVLTELTWWVRLIHLGVAELVVASIAIAWLSSGDSADESSTESEKFSMFKYDKQLIWGTLVGVLGLILYGSYMVGLGYGSSCMSWPLCQGLGVPSGEAFAVHMGHRYLALIVGALVIGVVLAAWRRGTTHNELRWLAALAAGFLGIEVLIGAFTVWTGFAVQLKSLHLTVATLMWASTTLLAAVYLAPGQFRVPTWQGRAATS